MPIALVLQPKGTSRNAQIPAASLSGGKPSPELAGNILRRATHPEFIGTWKWHEIVVHLYAYKAGKAGTENKHELPPPHDTVLLFGEAVMFATQGSTFVKFSNVEYQKFYNETLGGFDDVGSEDSNTEDEEDEEEVAEEEEEEEVVEESESEDGSGNELEAEEEEEEEAPRRPAPKNIKTAAAKRNAKKIPTWYSLPELKPEPYKLQHPGHN